MIRLFSLAILIVSLLAFTIFPSESRAGPVVFAGTIKEINIMKINSGKLNPDLGYIFLRAPNKHAGLFLKEPSEQDNVAYQMEWEAAFQKALEKYKRKMVGWKVDSGVKEPEKPTRETFAIADLITWTQVDYGPNIEYTKAASRKDSVTYLMPVSPGTYIYYGPIRAYSDGYKEGICFCMGSLKFEVKAGEITNLGNYLLTGPSNVVQAALPGRGAKIGDVIIGEYEPQLQVDAPVDFSLPASLQSFPSHQPEFRAAGKIDNYFGLTISRMAPVAGVLAYNRDRVIDVISGKSP